MITMSSCLGATCYLAANLSLLLWCFSLSLRARYRSVFHHHLATASEHLAAVVLLVLLLPAQGEVQVHVLCQLQHQDQAGIFKDPPYVEAFKILKPFPNPSGA